MFRKKISYLITAVLCFSLFVIGIASPVAASAKAKKSISEGTTNTQVELWDSSGNPLPVGCYSIVLSTESGTAAARVLLIR